jgi:hypothetical protein
MVKKCTASKTITTNHKQSEAKNGGDAEMGGSSKMESSGSGRHKSGGLASRKPHKFHVDEELNLSDLEDEQKKRELLDLEF